jgi:uncharacterized protein YdaU (DUF1376 family)
MHYYSFHPGDYLKDTAHLTNEEDLTYRRLLDFYHQSESPIPVETQSVSRRLRVGFEVVNQVLSEFFELREDGWHQARCDAAIAEYREVRERNQKNGILGGRPKKTQSVSSGNPVGTQSKPARNPNHKPITINQVLSTNVDRAAGRGTKEELVAYALELGLQASDGEFMFQHWTANGWKNGNASSKDWKAGMRKWKQGGWMPSQKVNGNRPNGTKPVALQRNYLEGLTPEQIGDF